MGAFRSHEVNNVPSQAVFLTQLGIFWCPLLGPAEVPNGEEGKGLGRGKGAAQVGHTMCRAQGATPSAFLQCYSARRLHDVDLPGGDGALDRTAPGQEQHPPPGRQGNLCAEAASPGRATGQSASPCRGLPPTPLPPARKGTSYPRFGLHENMVFHFFAGLTVSNASLSHGIFTARKKSLLRLNWGSLGQLSNIYGTSLVNEPGFSPPGFSS